MTIVRRVDLERAYEVSLREKPAPLDRTAKGRGPVPCEAGIAPSSASSLPLAASRGVPAMCIYVLNKVEQISVPLYSLY